KKITTALAGVILAFLMVSAATEARAYTYPLKSAANTRYLLDQNNRPFFWSGDTAWSLLAQVSREDAVAYLEDRRQKGFTVLLVNLIEHQFAVNAPRNYYGNAPFTGQAFTTPNEAYFAHADDVIREAANRGLVVLLAPLYLGYQCGSEGWCNEVKAAAAADLRSWGRYVGNRYRSFDNLVWNIGGDTDPTPVKSKVQEMVAGIREFDTRHLFTAHNQPESFGVTPWSGETWLQVNNVYSYSTALYQNGKTAYTRSPVLPFFLMESTYENEHSATQQQLRAQTYWTVLAGGFGFLFGNCPIWHFGSSSSWCGSTNWKGQLNSQGALSMKYAQQLFTSRAWQLLTPDFSHTVLTAGYGTWGSTDYVTAARASDGQTLIAYLPTSRAVTVDLTKIAGTQVQGWWYNPANGSATAIGTYGTTGSRTFTPPAAGDWVLVVDNATLNLPTPGTAEYNPLRLSPPKNLRIL
ncbi:MAG: glycoside hydrolase family 140 protein, partial [Deltaproteobacteria bacterium]|nr:glycoside hydrolase family 140 protein [Deltaproteobacteria bacterium]